MYIKCSLFVSNVWLICKCRSEEDGDWLLFPSHPLGFLILIKSIVIRSYKIKWINKSYLREKCIFINKTNRQGSHGVVIDYKITRSNNYPSILAQTLLTSRYIYISEQQNGVPFLIIQHLNNYVPLYPDEMIPNFSNGKAPFRHLYIYTYA